MLQYIATNQALDMLPLQGGFGYHNGVDVDIVRENNLNIELVADYIC